MSKLKLQSMPDEHITRVLEKLKYLTFFETQIIKFLLSVF